MNKVARDKDRILAQIKVFTPHHQIAGLDKYLPELERDGLVKTVRDEQHNPIYVRITSQGENILKQGGYTAMAQRTRRTSLKHFLSSSSERIIEAVVVAVLILIVSWWVKKTYGLSDNPQCDEHTAVKNDSTSSSLPSSRCLNADRVASRGKSDATCRDSSLSTFDKHSIGIPSNETSAEHSSVRDESKSTPSGK